MADTGVLSLGLGRPQKPPTRWRVHLVQNQFIFLLPASFQKYTKMHVTTVIFLLISSTAIKSQQGKFDFWRENSKYFKILLCRFSYKVQKSCKGMFSGQFCSTLQWGYRQIWMRNFSWKRFLSETQWMANSDKSSGSIQMVANVSKKMRWYSSLQNPLWRSRWDLCLNWRSTWVWKFGSGQANFLWIWKMWKKTISERIWKYTKFRP